MKNRENEEAQTVSPDGIDRRGFLQCMAWAGTGVLWTITGGVPTSRRLTQGETPPKGELQFVQISDSHIGFKAPANPDVAGTLRAAVEKINALPYVPAFVAHTGDITQNATEEEFDTCANLLKSLRTREILYVPGEHDVLGDEGKRYRTHVGKRTIGQGWYSMDIQGVHFIGLVNVMSFQNGLGSLGREQMEWLEKDVQRLKSSTPIVVLAHIPLWSVYPQWGWGTEDGAQALAALKRFGCVTVLNGHIHQTLQKIEGDVVFHTAASTAFPQPKPGMSEKPGPMKVEPGRLRSLLGITEVTYVRGAHALAVTDSVLSASETP
jgi:hypothetical protein